MIGLLQNAKPSCTGNGWNKNTRMIHFQKSLLHLKRVGPFIRTSFRQCWYKRDRLKSSLQMTAKLVLSETNLVNLKLSWSQLPHSFKTISFSRTFCLHASCSGRFVLSTKKWKRSLPCCRLHGFFWTASKRVVTKFGWKSSKKFWRFRFPRNDREWENHFVWKCSSKMFAQFRNTFPLSEHVSRHKSVHPPPQSITSFNQPWLFKNCPRELSPFWTCGFISFPRWFNKKKTDKPSISWPEVSWSKKSIM